MSETDRAAGADLPARTIRVEQADIIRFAGACGDFNPLHFDPEVAARAGFSAPIAMGQMTAGMVASWVADWCGVERLMELQVRFISPVVAGDDLVLTGNVTGVRHIDTGRVCSVALNATANGRAVVVGTALINQGNERAE